MPGATVSAMLSSEQDTSWDWNSLTDTALPTSTASLGVAWFT